MSETKMADSSSERSYLRKIKKPLIERRRRERINSCLNELKHILLENIKQNGGTQVSKLDKADILEMTVSHLRQIHHQQLAVAMAASASVVKQYQEGYSECASETVRYLATTQGPIGLTSRVQHHVSTKVGQLTNFSSADKIVPSGNFAKNHIKIEIPKPQKVSRTDSNIMNQGSSLLMPVHDIKQERYSDVSPEVTKSPGCISPQSAVLSLPPRIPISVAESPSQKAVWRPF